MKRDWRFLGIGVLFVLSLALTYAGKAAQQAKHEAEQQELIHELELLRNEVDSLEQDLRDMRLRVAEVDTWAHRFRIKPQLAAKVLKVARELEIEPRYAFGIIYVESRFYPSAVGGVGEIGLMQVRPSTARWIQPDITRARLFDPETNIRIGLSFFRDLMYRYNDARLALLAYNRGPGTVDRYLRNRQDPANGYAAAVFRAAE